MAPLFLIEPFGNRLADNPAPAAIYSAGGVVEFRRKCRRELSCNDAIAFHVVILEHKAALSHRCGLRKLLARVSLHSRPSS